MRARSTTLALALVLAVPAVAIAQQPEKKPEAPKAEQPKPEQPKPVAPAADAAKPDAAKVAASASAEIKAGDVSTATPLQVLSVVAESGTAASAIASAQITDVRLVSSADVLDAGGNATLGLLLTKHEADVAKLRQATALSAPIKAALATANVSNDRVIGISVNGSAATVYYRAP